jgi:putative ATP-binding cassette transporter
MRGIGPFLKDAWRLSRPYFLTSEEKWSARGLLLAIVAMNLSIVGLTVIFNFWHRDFYNALQDKDWKAFLELLFLYRISADGFMPGFSALAVIYIALGVYSVYVFADPLAPLADPAVPVGMAG